MTDADRSPTHTDFAAPIEEQSVARWVPAAEGRRSRRSYLPEPVAGPAADALSSFCESTPSVPGARVVLLRRAPDRFFTGWLLGVYGKVSSPSALVFVADRRLPDAAARAGYAGEAAVLEATALGFATCWIGGGVRRKEVTSHLGLAPHEHVYSISALGYAPADKTIGERATAGMARAHVRRGLADLAPGSDEWPDWARRALELVRIAPSATSRQPWRFALESARISAVDGCPAAGVATPAAPAAEPSIRVFFEGRDTPVISKRLDCGIAMLHLELGARRAGVAGRWTSLSGNNVARFDPEPAS